jgi:hypothetical protein
MVFDRETIDVLIGGYLSRAAANEDFESVRRCGGYLHAVTVLGKDLEGNLSAQLTDHMVREGAAGLAGAGFVVGLFVPRLLPVTTTAGAAIGAALGLLLHRLAADELKQHAGASIPLGGAGLVVAYPKSAANKVRPAVKRAITIAVGEAKGHHLRALAGAVKDAEHKAVAVNA